MKVEIIRGYDLNNFDRDTSVVTTLILYLHANCMELVFGVTGSNNFNKFVHAAVVIVIASYGRRLTLLQPRCVDFHAN